MDILKSREYNLFSSFAFFAWFLDVFVVYIEIRIQREESEGRTQVYGFLEGLDVGFPRFASDRRCAVRELFFSRGMCFVVRGWVGSNGGRWCSKCPRPTISAPYSVLYEHRLVGKLVDPFPACNVCGVRLGTYRRPNCLQCERALESYMNFEARVLYPRGILTREV
jgi:hypothetical protein